MTTGLLGAHREELGQRSWATTRCHTLSGRSTHPPRAEPADRATSRTVPPPGGPQGGGS